MASAPGSGPAAARRSKAWTTASTSPVHRTSASSTTPTASSRTFPDSSTIASPITSRSGPRPSRSRTRTGSTGARRWFRSLQRPLFHQRSRLGTVDPILPQWSHRRSHPRHGRQPHPADHLQRARQRQRSKGTVAAGRLGVGHLEQRQVQEPNLFLQGQPPLVQQRGQRLRRQSGGAAGLPRTAFGRARSAALWQRQRSDGEFHHRWDGEPLRRRLGGEQPAIQRRAGRLLQQRLRQSGQSGPRLLRPAADQALLYARRQYFADTSRTG